MNTTKAYEKLVFLDTETTGTGAEDRLCQVAYQYQGKEYNQLFKPPLAISVEAMAVCHVTNKMVEDKDAFEGGEMHDHLQGLFKNGGILVAHNAAFDIAMLAKEGIVVDAQIDTLKIAQHLDQEALIPRYNLQYLRYFLDLDIAPEDAPAHDALGDIRVLVKLFDRLYEKMHQELGDDEAVIAEMIKISELPLCIKRFTFGKYNGRLVSEVAQEDKGYLEWLSKQKQEQRAKGEADEDWEYTLKQYLG